MPHEDAVYDRVGNILLSRIMGAQTQTGGRRFDIGIRDSWKRAPRRGRGRGRQALRDPGRRLGAQVRRARLRRLRRGGARPGEGPRLRLRPYVVGLHGHRLDPCRHGRGLQAGRGARKRSSASTPPAPRPRPRPRCSRSRATPRRSSARARSRRATSSSTRTTPTRSTAWPSKETVEAIRLSARLEAMITDPVYEGKSMQGMIDLVKKGFFPKGSKVLYAHLGGAPALNGTATPFGMGDGGGHGPT